ncbi:uncharacterized protein Z520_10992 [Fonsecaea multimorphosa CBS 102226]|uniref:Protein BIG1 n=1 Tax=Fonsecaea multimorphosa CBS 102226 TaxID=1442371 RepID=A0A0D2JSE9_9EURO|nr:uncharacterized protein Z520_10992 [Fonsecaea multimorphosa CBS 102226]KIX93349.1 hypothetical protein Z520_10992 [Fonsecaea multimorphosa CBS 102226]OAL18586.1 hypothetical protein AYO22_10563 [Fonsecaea multimorphosa]
MRLIRLCALALAAECAHGYLDSTPFFMFSTSELLATTSHVQSAPLLTSEIALTLSSCPSDYYILVSQPGVSAKDYSNSKRSTPLLARALSPSQAKGSAVRSSLTIPDVFGRLDSSAWVDVLKTKCGVSVTSIDASKEGGGIPTKELSPSPRLLELVLPAPSTGSNRVDNLSSNDAFLASVLDLLPTQNYTVLYTTSRTQDGILVAQGADGKDAAEYDMDSQIQESMHIDLKRDLGVHASANKTGNNQTMIDGPLFDKYQFFGPGIFMGYLVGFLLLTILYVAISGVASLQVTYAAFDKDQGQLATKKQ